MPSLETLYQDETFLVINKKAGISVHGGEKTKNSIIDSLHREKKKYSLLHRLDKETAGVLVLTKKKASKNLNQIITKSTKKYLAIVKGKITAKTLRLTGFVKVQQQEKWSSSIIKTLKRFSHYSLLEITLITGRSHQIRKQLQSINHPILGDDKYGDFELNHREKFRHLFLFAERIILAKQKPLLIKAPMPDYFKNFLKKYNVELPSSTK